MYTVFSCLALEHDARYLAIAAAVCALGSVLSMRLFARLRRSDGPRRPHWLLLAGLVAGGTIWTTHFAAMLGYDVPVERSFDPQITVLSLLLAVAFTAAGFLITARGRLTPLVELGGVVFGLGIAVMHFVGMRALLMPAIVEWDATLVVASVVLGMFFGAVAMNRIARPVTRFCKYGGALAMVLAIATMHFTAMGAMTVYPLAGAEAAAQSVSDSTIAAAVIVTFALVLMTGGSAYMIDLHAANEASAKYRHMALHDPLTGLPNRSHLAKRLADLLAHNRDDTARIALLAIDLDRFKDVNDAHGHMAGDAVLQALAERLGGIVQSGEFLARVGGDEFVAIKHDIFTRNEAVRFAERLRRSIVEPTHWEGRTLTVGCSIGIATFPDDGAVPELLMTRADLALYRAKSMGRNKVCVYDQTMDESGRSRAALAMDMRRAIACGEFELYYQPQNDTVSRDVIGFEALLRWNHPERGTVSPAEFIPIAEETGLILELGDWVLRTACATAARWSKPYRVAVNLAPMQLGQPGLAKRVAEILKESGLAASRLEVELTESGIIADQQHALDVIRALKAQGVLVAMDDFGSGYSSLSTLKNFPFDKIKIDREFMAGLADNVHAAAIVKATILLGTSLRIPVLAEGVETEQHLSFLREQGCAAVQGYLFGKPMPERDIRRLIDGETLAGAKVSPPAPRAADAA